MDNNVQSVLQENISNGVAYASLPSSLRRIISSDDYESQLLQHSLAYQIPYKHCSRDVKKGHSEKQYYAAMQLYCRQNSLVYPYKFEEQIIAYTGILPFNHYHSILYDMMKDEKSYDTMPNFTAVDCLRLTGIGRNQYIDAMNKARAKRKMFKINKDLVQKLLPTSMIDSVKLEPWWKVQLMPGATMEKVLKECTQAEQEVLSQLRKQIQTPGSATPSNTSFSAADTESPLGGSAGRAVLIGDEQAPATAISQATSAIAKLATSAEAVMSQLPLGQAKRKKMEGELVGCGERYCCTLPYKEVHSLHRKGLLHVVINIDEDDTVVVPPLQNFVMNRTTDDPFERLLYDILVSIDSRTTVQQLCAILDRKLEDVKNAVAVYCRLGLAYKKSCVAELRGLSQGLMHETWLFTLGKYFSDTDQPEDVTADTSGQQAKRIAFLFDSELPAYLMMGNLGGALKAHAVTLFEAGKMTDELLDGLIEQLQQIDATGKEGEARRYFDHAVALGQVLVQMRHNRTLDLQDCDGKMDLLRSESLNLLDSATKRRILDKNYACILAMTPLSCSLTLPTCIPNFYGNPIALFASPWFRLFLANEVGVGPVMLALRRGTFLRHLPMALSREAGVTKILLLTWTMDSHPAVLCTTNALTRINDELHWQPVLLVAYEREGYTTELVDISFPYGDPVDDGEVEGLKKQSSTYFKATSPPAEEPMAQSESVVTLTKDTLDLADLLQDAKSAPSVSPRSVLPQVLEGAEVESTKDGESAAGTCKLETLDEAKVADVLVSEGKEAEVGRVPIDSSVEHNSPRADSGLPSPASEPPEVLKAHVDPTAAIPSPPSEAPKGDEEERWCPADHKGESIDVQGDLLMKLLTRRLGLHCSIGYVKMEIQRPSKPPPARREAAVLKNRSEMNSVMASLMACRLSTPRRNSEGSLLVQRGGDLLPDQAVKEEDEKGEEEAEEEKEDEEEAADEGGLLYPSMVFFGVPIADPAFTQQILDRIETHRLLTQKRMDAHSANMYRLAVRFMSFISSQLGYEGPLLQERTVEKSHMCVKQQSPVPFLSKSLFFDGQKLIAVNGANF